MPDTLTPLLIPALSALAAAALTALVTLVNAQRGTSTQAQQSYYEDIRTDLDRLERRFDRLQRYVTVLEDYVDELRGQMVAAGLKPAPRPERPKES